MCFSWGAASSSSCITNFRSRSGGVYWGIVESPGSGREIRKSGAARPGAAARCEVGIDQPFEGGSRALQRPRRAQQARVVVQRQDLAVHLEQQLLRVGGGLQLAALDREPDRAL